MTERGEGPGPPRPASQPDAPTEAARGGMNEGSDARRPPDTASGWLIVRRDGTVVTAERRACTLLGAPDADALAGREWTSLLPFDRGAPTEARLALVTGGTWSGRLTYRYARDEVTLDTVIMPVTRSADLSVVSLEPPPPSEVLEPPARPASSHPRPGDTPRAERSGLERVAAAPEASERVLAAQLAAHEALRDLSDPAAAARAVLQALQQGVPFDWGVALRFEGDEVAVLATYPSPMAGVAAGLRWRPPGEGEAALVATGEPTLEGDLAGGPDGTSPLGRLPAFGLRSRLCLPLHAGPDVAGAVLIYRAGPRGFDAVAGMVAERTVRRLGETLAAPPAFLAPPAPAGAEAGPAESTQPAHEEPPAPAEPPSPAPPSDEPTAPPRVERLAEDALPASRLESLGELVAGVAHELNNPLTAILGYAQIVSSLEGAEREHALRTIEAEAQRAARIVRNLLAFARQRPGERHDTDLESVLRRIVDLRRYSLEVDDIHVITRFGHIPPVHVDEGQFEQVFLNLLSNAHQALQGRGGEIQISTWMREGYVYVSIADDGPGVPEEMRGRVFEPFFTTREVGAGEGMGLSIVYGVVTNHGGRTWVEPSPSGGANFIVALPLEARSEAPAPARPPRAEPEAPARVRPARPAAENKRILVVDDEEPVRALTQEILAAQGYEVSTADNGHAALRILEHDSFGLVITDLRMPGIGGADLYHEIERRWPHLRDRVLFVTGDIEGDRGGRALDREQIRYLEKPFTTQQLLEAIRNLTEPPGAAPEDDDRG